VHGLEVEPPRDPGLQVDHDVVGHRVAVREAGAVEVGQGACREPGRAAPGRRFQPRRVLPDFCCYW
jgi:hypothetical protein